MYQDLCFAALDLLISSAVVMLGRNGVIALSLFNHFLACRLRVTDMCCPTSISRPDAGNCHRVQRLASRLATRASGLSSSARNATGPSPAVALP